MSSKEERKENKKGRRREGEEEKRKGQDGDKKERLVGENVSGAQVGMAWEMRRREVRGETERYGERNEKKGSERRETMAIEMRRREVIGETGWLGK